MLKKISLIGILVFSSFEAYSAAAHEISVDGEPISFSSPYVARGRGNYVEDIPIFTEKSHHTKAFELWQGSQVLFKFLELVKESEQFRTYMWQHYPSLTKVLEKMERRSPLSFSSIVVQEAGDLRSTLASVGPGALIRVESEGFIKEDDSVPTIVNLLKNENVRQAVLLDFSGTLLGRGISSIFRYISFSTLSAIDLDYCGLGSLGEECFLQLEEVFTSNQTIAHLGLAGNDLGDDGAQAVARILASNSKLLLLTLGDNSIGPPGAEALGHALGQNHTLCFLNLAFNQLEDGAWRFIELLDNNLALREVNLIQCGISRFSQDLFESRSSKKLRITEPLIDVPALEGLVVTEEERRRRISSSLR